MESSTKLEKVLAFGRKIIPRSIFIFAQPIYHYLLTLVGAIYYRYPARKLKVIMVTGTKGKSTVAEIVNAILEEAGKETIISNTIRYKIPGRDEPNKFKMTVQGRWFLQKLLADGLKVGATHAVIEMTSEGVKQFRHKFLSPDALIFTNLSPEHIEAHGSYENYRTAKLKIARELEHSSKPNKMIVVNGDDKEAEKFLAIKVPNKLAFNLSHATPWSTTTDGVSLTVEKTKFNSSLPGLFNIYNLLAGIVWARHSEIAPEIIARAIKKLNLIRGRMEVVIASPFRVIVDYAHTADSLAKVYEVYKKETKICVLGNAGGGRDKWKRPVMGSIASQYCEQIILTNEDPYDEDPRAIVDDMARGIKKNNYQIIIDRREAIRTALKMVKPGEVIIITGKGTDPYIMEANNTKTPWDDAEIVRTEFSKLFPNEAREA
ncbi:MAG: UDP-N-acetylmuramyl-tripeptide synthetase [Patescibacteria group bacterium]